MLPGAVAGPTPKASGTGIRDNWPKPIPDPCWDRIAADRPHLQQGPEPPSALPLPSGPQRHGRSRRAGGQPPLLLSRLLTMGAASYCRRRTSASMCWTKPITCPPSPGSRRRQRQHQGIRRWLEKLVQSAGKLARTLNKESLLDPSSNCRMPWPLSAGSQGPRAVARQQ